MKAWIFYFVLTVPGLALASYDITCTNNNCWNTGWTVVNHPSQQTSEVQCIGNSCQDNGWIQRHNGRYLSEVACLRGGCWTEGFNIYNRDGQKVSGFRCEEDPNLGFNCLTAGWSIEDWRGREVGYAECIASDCERYGWDVHMYDGRLQVIRCKQGSCFTNGWTLRP